jgi:hypothetical protein
MSSLNSIIKAYNLKKSEMNKVLPAPEKPSHLPLSIQWLSGEGGGSWFLIEESINNYKISRYSPKGEIECEGLFDQFTGKSFDINSTYDFTYLSHCSLVSIIQNKEIIKFKLITKC